MNNLPDHLAVFLLGMVGALAPEIVRVYGLRQTWGKERFSLGYWIISAVYAALGGVLAVILPAVNLYAAFYAGVTTPVTISAMVRQKRKRTLALANAHEDTPAPWFDPKAAHPKRSLKGLIQDHADGLFD
jgi:hypothetical protein